MTARLQRLEQDLAERRAVLGVIGLGYVGLPVACLFADKGFRVIGVDRKSDRVQRINQGRNPIEGTEPGLTELLAQVVSAGRLRATTDYGQLAEADVITISVETPVESDHRPRFAALEAACQALGPVLKPGALVIVESTLAPGTMARVVRPALERASGKQAGADFYLGHCPERVMPGRLLTNLRTMSRVVGGQTPEVAQVMVALYRQIAEADLDATDILTAELVKTAENAYRDVNIAFANQLALICQEVGGDVWRVRELVNKSPGRHVLLPGAGVGGHCIPKDPWLLAAAVNGSTDTGLITAARRLNDGMPVAVARLVIQTLEEAGVNPAEHPRVAVLGYAYLEESDDTRNSPTEALIAELFRFGSRISVHDPFVTSYRGDVLTALTGTDCAVVMVAHSAYRTLDLPAAREAMRHPLLVDARHVFSPLQLTQAGFRFRSLGVGPQAAAARVLGDR